MQEKKKNLKRIISGLFCFIMLSAVVLIPAEMVSAKNYDEEHNVIPQGYVVKKTSYNLGDISIYKKQYLNQVYPEIKQIGQAYVVGIDKIANYKKRVSIEKVPLGTVIQGVAVDEKYLDQNNMANLEAIYSSVITGEENRPNYDKSIAYLEGEEAVLPVVAVNGDKVIFWSNGYRAFSSSGVTAVSCSSSNWLLTHPPGFYQISVNQVLLSVPTEEYNVIPKGEENNVAATGNVTYPINVWQKPLAEGRGSYALGKNVKVYLASTEKLPALDGSDKTYYKIIFTGYNGYMANTYAYVNSLYVDVDMDGANKPSDLQTASIVGVDSNKHLNLFAKKDSNSAVVGKIKADVNIKYSPSESDSEWVTLWFSGQRCYIRAKYVEQGQYIQIKDTGRLAVKDIVDGQYVVRWDPTNTNKGYTIAITSTDNETDLGKFGWYWLYTNKDYTKNEFTIDSSYFKDEDGKLRNAVYFRVSANGGTQTFKIGLPRLKVLEETKKPTWDKAGGISTIDPSDDSVYFNFFVYGIGAEFQMATDKNFTKNVKSVASNTTGYTFKDLKPNKTYYFRFRHRQSITTVDGETISAYGPWSKVKKIKTEKTPVYDYVKKVTVKDIKDGQYIVTWNKPSGAKTYTVLVTENVTQKVLYSNKKYNKNTLTVKKKWFQEGEKEVVVSVTANTAKGANKKALIVLELPTQTASTKTVEASSVVYSEYNAERDVVPKAKITVKISGRKDSHDGMQVQFSTDKNFDDAKTYTTDDGISKTVAGFEIGQTYYVRYRHIKKVETKAGDKYLYGKWSDPVKMKTTDKMKEIVAKG